ncbi:MAG: hypothetical protein R3B55_02185 [Candidatus Paceibacterota bacterium]
MTRLEQSPNIRQPESFELLSERMKETRGKKDVLLDPYEKFYSKGCFHT